MKTIHFTVGSNSRTTDSSKLEKQLRTLITQRVGKRFCCSKCQSQLLEYEGLGKYICKNCGEANYSNYGKVRQCLETYGSMSVFEVMEATGLTKDEIKQLEEEGSITLSHNGKIQL